MNIRTAAMACSIIAIAAACSGSDDPNPEPPVVNTPPPAPVIMSAKASGTITGFSSVVVNGDTYETDNDTVYGDDDDADVTGDQSGLSVGMRVEIDADEDENGNLTATRIDYDDDLRGPAEMIAEDPVDSGLGAFMLACQTVTVDPNTVFEDIADANGDGSIDIRDLDVDPAIVVEVSGYPTPDGFIATHVERDDDQNAGDPAVDGDEIEVKGFVTAVAMDGSTITVNDTTTFNVLNSSVLEDGLVINDELIGSFVDIEADVTGTACTYDIDEIEADDDVDYADNDDDDVDIEGYLSSVDTMSDPHEIVINGQTIQVDDAAPLSAFVGKVVEIEGEFNDQMVLELDETDIEEEEENEVRVVDQIESITDGVITTRLGITIEPTTDSRVVYEGVDGGASFTPTEFLDRLTTDIDTSTVVIDAISYEDEDDNDAIVWTRITATQSDAASCTLRGPVTEGSFTPNSTTFGILGVTVDTANVSGTAGFFDEDDNAVNRMTFFANLEDDEIVEVISGTEASAMCAASALTPGMDGTVSIDPDDDIASN